MSYRRAAFLDALHSSAAKDTMTREYPVVPPKSSLEQVVHQYALVSGFNYFAVAEDNKLLGIVNIAQIKRVRKKKWVLKTAGDVMTPVKRLRTVPSGVPADIVIEIMDQFRIDDLPVMEQDELIGVVVRDRLTNLAWVRAELKS